MRHGREKLHYLNAAPINEISERWISHYDRGRAEALADLKRGLEEPEMSKPTFVYTTYIRTTPEQLWKGLTDPAFTSRYWNTKFETDWKPGSTMVWDNQGARIDDPEQVVLVADPFTRLSYTWHTFTPGWRRRRFTAEQQAAFAAAPLDGDVRDRGQQPMVKLTVIHGTADPDSAVLTAVGGWPKVVAAWKTCSSGAPSASSSSCPDSAAPLRRRLASLGQSVLARPGGRDRGGAGFRCVGVGRSPV